MSLKKSRNDGSFYSLDLEGNDARKRGSFLGGWRVGEGEKTSFASHVAQ